MLLVIGRLVHPGSERHLFDWAQHLSGLDELINSDFSRLSLNSLYKVMDVLFEHKTEIETHLRHREKTLFSLDETIILYDLTNTYFEGQALGNDKARFGRSKEKRSDCRLLTLGLVIDGQGFPKVSQVFSGNQSEPETLLDMVNSLCQHDPTNHSKPTVVIDAGTVLANHLLHSTRTRLKERGYSYSWPTIRDRMVSHCRVTNRMETEKKDILFIRKCSQPESFHKKIYKALGLPEMVCRTKKKLFKICSDP